MTVLSKVFSSSYGVCIGVFLCLNFFVGQCSLAGVPAEEHKKMSLDFHLTLSVFKTEKDEQIMKLEINRNEDVYFGKKHEYYTKYMSDIKEAKEESGTEKSRKEKQKFIEDKYKIWKDHKFYASKFIKLSELFKFKEKDGEFLRGEKTIKTNTCGGIAKSLFNSVKEYINTQGIDFNDISDTEVLSVQTYANNEMKKALKDTLNDCGSEVELDSLDGEIIYDTMFDGIGFIPNECVCTIVDI